MLVKGATGAKSTEEISFEFQIQLRNVCLYLRIHQFNHKEILPIPRQQSSHGKSKNFVVIGSVFFKLWRWQISLNSKLGWIFFSGTDCRPLWVVNSLMPCAICASMSRIIIVCLELVQSKACWLFGAKSLSELMPTCYQLDQTNFNDIFIKIQVSFKKLHFKNLFFNLFFNSKCSISMLNQSWLILTKQRTMAHDIPWSLKISFHLSLACLFKNLIPANNKANIKDWPFVGIHQ